MNELLPFLGIDMPNFTPLSPREGVLKMGWTMTAEPKGTEFKFMGKRQPGRVGFFT
jgi:hypothetical protein